MSFGNITINSMNIGNMMANARAVDYDNGISPLLAK